jgi:hypothetical protein
MKISKGVVKMNNLTHYFQAKQSTIQTKWGKIGMIMHMGYQ